MSEERKILGLAEQLSDLIRSRDALRAALLKAEVGLDAIYPRAHVLKGIRQALADQQDA